MSNKRKAQPPGHGKHQGAKRTKVVREGDVVYEFSRRDDDLAPVDAHTGQRSALGYFLEGENNDDETSRLARDYLRVTK